jgi:hypothetical protein
MSFLDSKFDLCILELPEDFTITQGEAFNKLQSKKFKELSASQEFGDGWVNISDMFKDFSMEDSVVVNSVVGGYRFDKKKVPPALIKKLFKEKLKEKFNEGIKLSKDDKKSLKQECKEQLMMQTLATPKMATWIIDLNKNLVYLSTKSMFVVDTFKILFSSTFDISLKIKNFSFEEEEEISNFLDFLWSNIDSNAEKENPDFWIDQEITLDFDKNTFKFNGPRIEEYKEEINNFKKLKRIKSINLGLKIGESNYSLTFNNKNMILGIQNLDKITHESMETAIIDNEDRIHSVIQKVEDLVKKYNK